MSEVPLYGAEQGKGQVSTGLCLLKMPLLHPGVEWANLESISYRCYFWEVAFE